jgi:SAM-dependent methyltransferase
VPTEAAGPRAARHRSTVNEVISSAPAADVKSGSPDRFGYEWAKYSELLPEHEEQFRRWTVHIAPEEWRDKVVLDVGCGMGRNSYWPLTYGARECVSIDVDQSSLHSARRTLAAFPNARVMEMSAYEIAFTDHFDLVYSIGVIHHLAEPAIALHSMANAARPGGRVLIWVYGSENNRWIVRMLDPLRKTLFSKLPIDVVHHLSTYPAALLWVGLRLGVGRIEYFNLIRKMRFSHLRSIVFDQMLPKIAHYWPRDTVEQMMREAGLTDVRLAWVNEMSWSAIGTKPGISPVE